ncbi:SUKH-4 family immunity protein [Streptomyces sp. NBC_00378]|uniref:SUKH-4 family immunity protein n=1 Tax=unclassified Streptomyces TaxID=2593676 RepID=UPI00225AE1C6|nr:MULTISPECIES: SUKH-4 family immunity protein [unclassified Streptomyces]MCX5110614.1 SUKH-4 family immunity protein [Streptomyces sp. NBC_00378]
MVSRERLVEVFGEDTVLLLEEAVPEELRRQPAGQTLMHTGLPGNLLDAISSVPGLEEGVKTYSEHCEEVGIESDERIRAMYRIGFAGNGDILVEPATGDVYYAVPEADIIRRINTSVDKYVEDLCTLEAERGRFDFLDEEDVAIQREELSDVLRESDEAAWGTASSFWRWIIEQISADDYRVF